MKFWTLFNWVTGIGIAVFIGSILFMPFTILTKYASSLFTVLLILGVLSILYSAYTFVKGIPQRKWGSQKTEKKFLNVKLKTWKSIGEWIIMLAILFLVWQYQKGEIGSKDCPDSVRGKGNITIKYFYTPFCPLCWKGEQAVQKILPEYPNVRFENYDIRYCRSAAENTGVKRSPAFAIINTNETKILYGIESEPITRELCDLGECL